MSQPSGEIILYERDDGAPAIEVLTDGETVWLSQQQIAELLGTSQHNVSIHLQNVFEEGELEEAATHKDSLSVVQAGSRRVEDGPSVDFLERSLGYRDKGNA